MNNKIDQAILTQVHRIVQSRASKDDKYQALDQLYLHVIGNHPDGLGAQVLETISQASTRVLYPDWKGGAAQQ